MIAENPPSEATCQRARIEAKLFSDYSARKYLEDAQLATRYPHLEEFADTASRKGEKKRVRIMRLHFKLRDLAGLLRSAIT
jgi:hypothetical protein